MRDGCSGLLPCGAGGEGGGGRADDGYLGGPETPGFYNFASRVERGHVSCKARVRGRLVWYVQVYKVNSIGFCGNLEAMAAATAGDRSQANLPAFAFTFVREPLERFVSGYAEISMRASRSKPPPGYRGCDGLSFLQQRSGSQERAAALVYDVLSCRLGAACGTWETDIHALPQVGFLAGWLARPRGGDGGEQHAAEGGGLPPARVDFVGRLERVSSDWAALSDALLGRSIPYNSSVWWSHSKVADAARGPLRIPRGYARIH